MSHIALVVVILGSLLGHADETADYKRLCDIWRKTETEAGRPGGVVCEGERRLLLEELGGHRAGIAPHDFRRMAAITLGNLRAGEAVPRLIERLGDRDENPMTSAEAASALGKIGDVEALPHLLDALDDTRPGVRTHAAQALRTLAPARQAVKPFSTGVRFAALLDQLELVPLPEPGGELLAPEITPARKRAFAKAQEVDALCTGLDLARPEPLEAKDRERAEELAGKLLRSGLPAAYYGPDGLAELTAFCRTYQPGLYADKIQRPDEIRPRVTTK